MMVAFLFLVSLFSAWLQQNYSSVEIGVKGNTTLEAQKFCILSDTRADGSASLEGHFERVCHAFAGFGCRGKASDTTQ